MSKFLFIETPDVTVFNLDDVVVVFPTFDGGAVVKLRTGDTVDIPPSKLPALRAALEGRS